MKSKLIISLFAMAGVTTAIGCGDDTTTGGEVTKIEGTSSSKFVASSLTLPKNATTLAFDLDGDGTADNRLGNIIQAISALNLDPQSSADEAVMDGSLVLLMDEVSSDATQQSASNAGVKLAVGNKPATPPKFDGTDTFTIDTATAAPAQFYGNITGGVYTSNNPATTSNPVVLTIGLPLVEGQPPLTLPVTAGRITFKVGTDGKVTGGQINGAIKKSDVDGVILPAVAALVTAELQKPDASAALAMFDPNGDKMVSVEEIKMNQLIANFLAADIQLFQDGVYKPNPAKTTKDSLSLGLGFTAVKASF